MFGNDTVDSLPPSTLTLITQVLDSPYLTRDVYSELLEDICLLSHNCWRIYKRSQAEKEVSISLES